MGGNISYNVINMIIRLVKITLLIIYSVLQILFPNSKKKRKGCSCDMSKWVSNSTLFSSSVARQNYCTLKSMDFISGKKEKSMISEHEKACCDKIAQLEDSLKKKTQVYHTNHKFITIGFPESRTLSLPLMKAKCWLAFLFGIRMIRPLAFWGRPWVRFWTMHQMKTSHLMIEDRLCLDS